MGCSPWGHKQLDMTEVINTFTLQSIKFTLFFKKILQLKLNLCVRLQTVRFYVRG